MSLLPQRKKSPEEIARIRENLGIPVAVATPPDATPPAPQPLVQAEPLPPAPSLTAEPSDPLTPEPTPTPHTKPESDEEVIVLPVAGKIPVKATTSLRKTEPTPARRLSDSHLPAHGSKLPAHRHANSEIEEIRRRQRLSEMNAAPNPKLFPAHPAAIIPGYIPPITAGVGFYFYDFHIAITAACLGASLVFATIIFLWKPISRHHAAFITVFTLLISVFATIHYFFPHLRYAS